MPLELAAYVTFCDLGDRLVFLDVRRGRYTGTDAADACALRELWRGCSNGVAVDVAGRLVARGLLEGTGPAGSTLKPFTRPRPQREELGRLIRANPADLLRAAAGQLRAAYRLRRRGLADSLGMLPSPPGRPEIGSGHDSKRGTDAARAAAAFTRTDLLFATHSSCLPRSVALAALLRRRGVAADLLLGVRLHPFTAHAWVEFDGAVIGDRLERVRLFIPIGCF